MAYNEFPVDLKDVYNKKLESLERRMNELEVHISNKDFLSPIPKNYYNVNEVSKMIGFSRVVVNKDIEEGRLKAKVFGKSKYIHIDEITKHYK